jgi:hypothetical protein
VKYHRTPKPITVIAKSQCRVATSLKTEGSGPGGQRVFAGALKREAEALAQSRSAGVEAALSEEENLDIRHEGDRDGLSRIVQAGNRQ